MSRKSSKQATRTLSPFTSFLINFDGLFLTPFSFSPLIFILILFPSGHEPTTTIVFCIIYIPDLATNCLVNHIKNFCLSWLFFLKECSPILHVGSKELLPAQEYGLLQPLPIPSWTIFTPPFLCKIYRSDHKGIEKHQKRRK